MTTQRTIYKYNDKCCLVFGIRKLIYQEVKAKTQRRIRNTRSNIKLSFYENVAESPHSPLSRAMMTTINNKFPLPAVVRLEEPPATEL